MAKISFSEVGRTPFERLLGHSQEVLCRWGELEQAFIASGTFRPEFKEEVRRVLAFENKCEY